MFGKTDHADTADLSRQFLIGGKISGADHVRVSTSPWDDAVDADLGQRETLHVLGQGRGQTGGRFLSVGI